MGGWRLILEVEIAIMAGAKYTETYKKVSAMGEKLKAAGKQGPSNDEQLHVRLLYSSSCLQSLLPTVA